MKYDDHTGDAPPAGLTFKIVFLDNGASSITINEHTDKAAGAQSAHAGTGKSMSIAAAPFYDRDMIEDFSSNGPHRQFFSPSGTLSTAIFQKPDFTAVDGCNTSFFGGDIPEDWDLLPNFFGTSAAAPNAAAVAALMLEAAGGRRLP